MRFLLSSHGVLGMNARNLLYVKPYNPRKAVAFADDKLKTKAYLGSRGIPVAKIYARIETRDQLYNFDFSQIPDECVLKPNFGFGGEGIIILKGRKGGMFMKNGKTPVTEKEIREHIEDILDGKYSVNGHEDTAFFEQILYPHDCFARFRPVGLPDIRVIVFNLVPVMAMLRIPTAESDGKANIHLGGIGIGIDIATGMTTHAAQYHHTIKELPHGAPASGVPIPYWDDILLISSRIQQITNIGYLAVDITIDEQMGPALLEVNARAGLTVQVANLAPLRARLERVKGLKVTTPEKGVRIGQDLFGSKTHKATRDVDAPEKPILGSREVVTIAAEGGGISVHCLVAPDRERSAFSEGLVLELLEKGVIAPGKEKDTYRVKFTLGGKKLQTLITAEPMPDRTERAVIGKRDLAGFLIDPSKQVDLPVARTVTHTDLRAVDKQYAQFDKDLYLLKHLKPVNLVEERHRAEQDNRYNPMLQYPEIKADLKDIEKRLEKGIKDDSPLGILLEKKRRELLSRIELLRHRGNAAAFTQASRALYGAPSSALIRAANAVLHNRIACDLPPRKSELLSAAKAQAMFQDALKRYSLHDWQVVVREKLVADCTVGGSSIYLRKDAQFSREHIAALIAHEVETHVLTAVNGDHQPYALFRRGCANYLDTQEGLAIYNQNQLLTPFHEKRYGPARSVLAVAHGMEHGFADLRHYLEELGYTADKALTKAFDVKRGMADTEEPGGFTKGIVYFRGIRAIEQFVRDGGDLKRLYIGKIALEDLELVEQIPELELPVLLPVFLREKPREEKKTSKQK